MKDSTDPAKRLLEGAKRFINNVNNAFTNGEPRFVPDGDVGKIGEFSSEYVLNNLALTDISYIKTLHNLYIEKDGYSSEIDVVAVTEKGILVVESKNLGGWIFGNEKSREWTQVFPNGEKYKFYNPVMQNDTHIRKLSQQLGIEENKFVSYIVFSDRCTLKEVPRSTDRLKIIKRNELLWSVKSLLQNTPGIFTRPEVDAMCLKMAPLAHVSPGAKRRHIEQAERFKSGETCPVCGKKLVPRKGRYGDFIGCSGYPECTYTRKIHNENK